jgi:hypothetical protein
MGIDGNYRCSLIYRAEEKGIYLRHNGVLKMYRDENQLKGSMFPTFFWLNSPFRGGKERDRIFFHSSFRDALPAVLHGSQWGGGRRQG